jgi:dihydroflavonol-4-reductase
MATTSLVMGASGFLGSHVTQQLVERGEDVRVWVRPSSSTRAFAALAVQRCSGELDDAAALREAMRDVDDVYYCIVDTRAWLRDPAALFRTNVDGLRHVLDAAVDAGVRRFVFCSTVGTIGLSTDGRADEDVAHDWLDLGGSYVQSRVAAETLVLSYFRDRALPAIVMCVSTTYGAPDYGSPHGRMVSDAALGRLPVYFGGNAGMEVVGIADAAAAFLLAAEKGRVGERYIVSESFMSWKDLVTTAADAVGRRPPRIGIPLAVLKIIGRGGDIAARLFRRDVVMNSVSVRLLHLMPPLDHSKATRELGWHPSPTSDAIRAAARFYVERQAKS